MKSMYINSIRTDLEKASCRFCPALAIVPAINPMLWTRHVYPYILPYCALLWSPLGHRQGYQRLPGTPEGERSHHLCASRRPQLPGGPKSDGRSRWVQAATSWLHSNSLPYFPKCALVHSLLWISKEWTGIMNMVVAPSSHSCINPMLWNEWCGVNEYTLGEKEK